MSSADGVLESAGGVAIRWERHAPSDPPRAVVLCVHGYGEHIGRYPHVFAHLTARGLGVAALDLRGHGRSGGPRGPCLDFSELVADVHLLATAADGWWPGLPRLLLGHSMGGLVSLLYLLAHPDAVRAAVLSAPALRVTNAGPPALRWIALALGRVVPALGFQTSIDATALSRDPAVGQAYVADPLVHRRATGGFVRAVEAAQARALEEAPRLRVPLLVLQGDADRVVDPEASRELAARLTVAHELVMLPGYYHELLNEPPVERARVLAAIDRWTDRWVLSPGA